MQPNPQETADLITFTEEILNGKLYFLCNVNDEVEPVKTFSSTIALTQKKKYQDHTQNI